MTKEQLRAAMRELYITQTELGRILGKGSNTVNRWLSGALPVPQYAVAYIDLRKRLRETMEALGALGDAISSRRPERNTIVC